MIAFDKSAIECYKFLSPCSELGYLFAVIKPANKSYFRNYELCLTI
jgi:hypothetical protein